MPSTFSVGDLIRRGVELRAHEAVALAQEVIAASTDHVAARADHLDGAGLLGPPTIETVHICADGSVTCRGCAVTPSVFEIALLLESMLPRGGSISVPGALRYTIARALLEVDAPPFESVTQLSQVLTRHEQPDRGVVFRELFARAAATTSSVPTPVDPIARPGSAGAARFDAGPAGATGERRRTMPSATELRRYLREMDRELFLARSQPARLEPALAPTPPTARRRRGGLLAALALAALALAITPMLNRRSRGTDPKPPAPASEIRVAPTVNAASVPASPPGESEGAKTAVAPPSRRADVPWGPASRPLSLVRAVERAEGPEFSPSFASDGTAMFFHTGRSTDARSALVSTDSLAGDLRVMTIVDDGARNYHVQPSPDGTRIAFDSDRDGERGVYVARSNGTDVTRVSGDGFAAVPTWSPDGGRLAFIRGEPDHPRVWNLWLLTLATGDTRQLTRFRYGQTWSASWFPDGRRICYAHEDRLVVLDLETGLSHEYPSPVAHRLVRTPAVSPDSRNVVFQVYRSGAWMLDLKNGSMRHVLTDPSAEEFAWSPDGRRVAFHSSRDGQWGIWVMGPP